MKMKHNKKRNTAFLYECLIKELTKTVVQKDSDKKHKIVETIKKYFHSKSPLKEELNLYNSILNSDSVSKKFSERFLLETKKDFNSLDRKEIFNLQTNLIKEINESISSNIFANFIPNYKNMATVGQFFNSDKFDAKRRLILEQRTLSILSSSEKTKEDKLKHIDNLTYKTFVNKFNATYENTLRKEQKDLLTNYITSFSDNGLGLKSFLNEEIGRLKNEISDCLESSKIKENKTYLENTNKILEKLNSFSKKQITEDLVKDIFYIQDFVSEVLT